MEKPVALGADHGGFALKEAVRAHLDERGVPYVDYGTHSEASVDYPDMAVPPCEAVVRGECACALLFCGTGVGISMAANKLDGIRACCCSDAFSAKYTRLHNDANALCLGARCRPGPCLRTGGPVSDTFEGGRHAAASPRYPRWSSADIHAEPSRKAEHKGD
ncbi:MAG: RpiB/LacA/LacB family sugar-phosphate isomerase [Ruthenibacterium lactatiformans]